MITLVFYRVSNSKDYGRHEFDYIYDNPQKILAKLRKLKDDEWKVFNMTLDGSHGGCNAYDFQEVYNDEELDGGWWCVVINN